MWDVLGCSKTSRTKCTTRDLPKSNPYFQSHLQQMILWFLYYFSYFAAIRIPVSVVCQREELLPKNQWYKKYPEYPSLCTTPEQLQQRHIPPLLPSNGAYTSQLLHVSVIFRHGSRAPTDMHPCWKGYDDAGADTAVWNCDLVALSSTPVLDLAQPSTTSLQDSMFVYEKRYDALSTANSQVSNILHGTCEVAQLLQRGYDQEYSNGHILKDAYIWDDTTMTLDPRLVLFNLSSDQKDWFIPDEQGNVHRPWEDPFTYFRSDDDPRTVMSGQVLLHGLFHTFMVQEQNDTTNDSSTPSITVQPRLAVHTADRAMDIMAPNENTCPRLTLLSQRAKQSREYQTQFVKSKEAQTMEMFALQELGVEEASISNFRDHALDCLITTICTDRDLPKALQNTPDWNQNSSSYGPNLFQRLLDYTVLPKTFVYRFNNSAFSKLSMIPLWNEIRSFFPLSRNPSNTRLALFSGHDTTLIPLLSSLGTQLYNGTEWIPYASMVIVEIHDIILYNVSDHELLPVKKKFPSFKAFRILYNGHVLTDKVEGCIMASDLCDISYLINQLDSFTTLDYSSACVVSDEEKEPSSTLFHDITHDVSLAKALFHTSGGIAFLILTIFFTAFISSLLTYVMMNRKCPRWCHSRCCHPGEKQRNNLSLRDYESITFNSSLARNENIVKPGWNDDPRRKSQLRYVEVPSWFLNDSEVESREIT